MGTKVRRSLPSVGAGSLLDVYYTTSIFVPFSKFACFLKNNLSLTKTSEPRLGHASPKQSTTTHKNPNPSP